VSESESESESASLWWKSAVVYQIYPLSFADGNGDGIGDLKGVLGKLDYLTALGVDVIWLSPIYRSPRDDNGYDISDYQDIDPVFGDLELFDQLLSAAHERGMKLMMDLVVNHTSDEHPWFVESRSSRSNPKRDWYWWRSGRDAMTEGTPGAEPTNWESSFSGSAWEFDESTGQYYLHLFSRKQPDLNWENVEVREAVYAMMNWWLDRGVDGFRMDVINMISKDTALPDGRLRPSGRFGDGSEFYIGGPRLHEFLQEMHHAVFGSREGKFITVGEMPGVTLDEAVLFTDQNRHELDMVFQFEHVQLDQGVDKWDARPLQLLDLKASLGRWQAGLAERGWNSLYWNNHDQPRSVSRFGDDGRYWRESAKLLATVLHLHRGTPYVYQGDEFGMTNFPFTDIEQFRDIESLNHYREAAADGANPTRLIATMAARSRDNARTPVQWTDGPQAGFTTGTPWIDVNPNYPKVNAAQAQADPDSIWAHFQRLIALRHELPVIAHGDFIMVLPEDTELYGFTRAWDGVTLLVIANFSSAHLPIPSADLSDWADAELLLGNYPGAHRHLRPWEARVYRR
jgi:oligo-1,6-glucosidase